MKLVLVFTFWVAALPLVVDELSAEEVPDCTEVTDGVFVGTNHTVLARFHGPAHQTFHGELGLAAQASLGRRRVEARTRLAFFLTGD